MPDNVAATPAAIPTQATSPKNAPAPAKVETTVTPVIETKVEPAKDPEKLKSAERYAAAVARAKRIEAENRKAAEKVKADRAALEVERAKLKETVDKATTHDEWSKLAQQDPMALLEKAGITKAQMLERIAKGDTRTPEEIAQVIVDKAIKEREAQVAKEQEARQAKETAEQERQHRETFSATEKYIESLIKAEPEKYEFLGRSELASQKVLAVIQEYYDETAAQGRPELLPYAEALETVEASLEADFEAFLTSSKKLAAKKAAEEATKQAQKTTEQKVQDSSVVASGSTDERLKGRFKEFEPRKPKVAPEEAAITTDDLFKKRNRVKLIEEIDQTIKQSKQ
jgi:hypothetical protein